MTLVEAGVLLIVFLALCFLYNAKYRASLDSAFLAFITALTLFAGYRWIKEDFLDDIPKRALKNTKSEKTQNTSQPTTEGDQK